MIDTMRKALSQRQANAIGSAIGVASYGALGTCPPSTSS